LNAAVHSRATGVWKAGLKLRLHPGSGRGVQVPIRREDSSAAGVRQRDCGHDPARIGANRSARGNRNPNGQDKRSAGCRRSRSGALTRNGGLETGSRFGRVKGRFEIPACKY
jgi:hypothetical protein